LTCEREVPARH